MEHKQINVKIPTELDKELMRYCIENGKKKWEVVEMALLKFLAKK